MGFLPKALRTVYENVSPLAISHCAEITRPKPARSRRLAMNILSFSTPRTRIIDNDSVIRVVANPAKPRGL